MNIMRLIIYKMTEMNRLNRYTNTSEINSPKLPSIQEILDGFSYATEVILSGEKDGILMHEMLARFPKSNSLNINLQDCLEELKNKDATFKLLQLIIHSAIDEIINDHKSISINVYLRDVSHPDFLSLLEEYESKFKFSPHKLIFEILEQKHGEINQTVINNIRILKKKGYKISIDDFIPNQQEGNHSLENHRILIEAGIKIDYVKIDGKYLRGYLDQGERSIDKKTRQELTKVISILKGHGSEVIGEWIQNEDDAVFAIKLGCNGLQGRELVKDFYIKDKKNSDIPVILFE